MKIVGRVVYSLVMVIFFLFTFNYAQDLMTSLYFEDRGIPILEADEVDYTFFYGSVPNYYKDEPMLSIDQNDYELRIFEIAKLEQSNSNYSFDPFLYITFHSKVHIMDGEYKLIVRSSEIDTHTDKQKELSFNLVRFRQLNLFVGVNELGEIYLNPEFFIEHSIKEIEIVKENIVLLTIDLLTHDFSTSIEVALHQFYETENKLPVNDDMIDEGIFPYHTHVMSDYVYVFVIAMVIYFVLLVIATYFTFFFKPYRRSRKTDVIRKIDGPSI